MLKYLKGEADNLLAIIACGIEDCILPNEEYKRKVEGEIGRTLMEDAFFISSHSDLFPQGMKSVEILFSRPSHPHIVDRLRLHGKLSAFEKWQAILPPT